jgi:hypothetical protein
MAHRGGQEMTPAGKETRLEEFSMRKITSVSRKAAGLAAVGIIAVTASAAMAIPAQAASVSAGGSANTVWRVPPLEPWPVDPGSIVGLGPACTTLCLGPGPAVSQHP